MARKLIGDPKLVAKAKAMRKRLVDGKPTPYSAIAKALRIGTNKAAWVLVNDKPGMDRAPKGTRGAKVAKAKGAKRPVTKAAKRTTAKRQTRRAA